MGEGDFAALWRYWCDLIVPIEMAKIFQALEMKVHSLRDAALPSVAHVLHHF